MDINYIYQTYYNCGGGFDGNGLGDSVSSGPIDLNDWRSPYKIGSSIRQWFWRPPHFHRQIQRIGNWLL